MPKYPMTFDIETPEGGGEARKEKRGEPWNVTYPGGGLRWYGSGSSMQKETRKRIRKEMNDSTITITKREDTP